MFLDQILQHQQPLLNGQAMQQINQVFGIMEGVLPEMVQIPTQTQKVIGLKKVLQHLEDQMMLHAVMMMTLMAFQIVVKYLGVHMLV